MKRPTLPNRPKIRSELRLPPISLLGLADPLIDPSPQTWEIDLGLSEVIAAFTDQRRYSGFIRQVLMNLVTDPQVIRWRQAILGDFIRNPTLIQAAQILLPRLASLRQGSVQLGQHRRGLLLETSDRLAELDLYITAVEAFSSALQSIELRSEALIVLRDHLQTLLGDPNYQALREDLPLLRAPFENINSVTVGINLDIQLRPESAVLLAVNEHQLGEPLSLLDRLIGSRTSEQTDSGIAPLHQFAKEADLRPFDPLFSDLDRLLTQVAQPVAKALDRYVRLNTRGLVGLEYEIAFYLCAANLITQLQAQGITFCQPEISENRQTQIEQLVNLPLALRLKSRPVESQVSLGDHGRIALLTGINSGGKTTYLQSVGLAQILFQAGLWIPAQQARMSPVDRIFTHFPKLETGQQGRLAEEGARIRLIFEQVTQHSLILLNETFASTSSGEALYLAQDMLCGMRLIGVRAIYATHLAELIDRIGDMERRVEGESRFISLVAGVNLNSDGSITPTYQITRRDPLGKSYAEEIAKRCGISLDQIRDLYLKNGL